VIVGGGISGLACAVELQERGIPFVILEESEEVGGRIRTDKVDGFLLDRGFQIFLTSYPECLRFFDYKQLQLQPFYPGAMVRHADTFHLFTDPLRRPLDALAMLSPSHTVGTLVDKLLFAVLRLQATLASEEEIYTRPDISIYDRLSRDVFFGAGFSEEFIDKFFRPFLGGIFFDTKLKTSAREFEFVIRMLSIGENCLPEEGMQKIPNYLKSLLPADSVRLNTQVKSIKEDGKGVTLSSGEFVAASCVVVATCGKMASQLVPDVVSEMQEPKKTTCLYFAIDGKPPADVPTVFLNGDGVKDAQGTSTINNVCFPSMVASSYAPEGKSLACVSLVGIPDQQEDQLVADVKKQLVSWFGPSANEWKPLRTYRIPFSQPSQEPPFEREQSVRRKEHLFLAGDHVETASINGALRAGARCARAVSDFLLPSLVQLNKEEVRKYAREKGINLSD